MGTIHKALKIRIYPTPKQETLILKSIGCARFVFNKLLEERIQVYEKLKDDRDALYRYKYKIETDLKKEYEWLKEPSKFALQSARMDLSEAYQNFFKSIKGIRAGQKVGYPKFKKKGQKDSYREYETNGNIAVNFETRKVKLPKLGFVTFRDQRCAMSGEIKQATISRTKTGKYFVSILYEQELSLSGIELTNSMKVVGLDMSLEKFFVDSDGLSPAYERLYRKSEKKLARLQRQASKKEKGSKNRKKAVLKVSKVHEKITNSRKDFTQKLSTKLVQENDVIVIETLSLKGMSQALNLGKSVMDLGYSQFIHQLQYKTLWNNKTLIEADKWFASSKTCHFCGFVKKDLLLQEREWYCPNCKTHLNRDCNAGKNLKNYGLKELGPGQPKIKPVEKQVSTLEEITEQATSVKQEASESSVPR